MSKSIIAALLIGGTIGTVVALAYSKKKYAIMIQSEIESVKESFKKNAAKNLTPGANVEEGCSNDPNLQSDYAAYSDNRSREDQKAYEVFAYNYNGHGNEELPMAERVQKKPYSISSEECGETGYEVVSLNYYADGVLADDADNLVDNVAEIVGEDFTEYFDRCEEDALYIRNEKLKCDFEICKDAREFADVSGGPYRSDGRWRIYASDHTGHRDG